MKNTSYIARVFLCQIEMPNGNEIASETRCKDNTPLTSSYGPFYKNL